MKQNYGAISFAILVILALSWFALQNTTPRTTITAPTGTATNTVLLSFGKFNYNPDTITVKKDVPVTIKADLKRITGCYQTFLIPELGVSGTFTEAHDSITFIPTKAGTFRFTCSMGMGRGTLIVQA